MFREMRRGKQALPDEEAREILYSATSGVLALSGDDDYPYALPISYFYDGNKLYFHCAKEGHKIDAIKRNDKASFCVIAQDDVSPEEYTTHFKSVIVFGRISIIEDELQKLYVEPAFQSMGVGKALLDFVTEEKGVTWLWALEKNRRAIAFYERHGFALTDEKILEEGTTEYLIKMVRI